MNEEKLYTPWDKCPNCEEVAADHVSHPRCRGFDEQGRMISPYPITELGPCTKCPCPGTGTVTPGLGELVEHTERLIEEHPSPVVDHTPAHCDWCAAWRDLIGEQGYAVRIRIRKGELQEREAAERAAEGA